VRHFLAAFTIASVLGLAGCSGDSTPTPQEAAQTEPAPPPPTDKPQPSDEVKIN
jgi:hypothetical protein